MERYKRNWRDIAARGGQGLLVEVTLMGTFLQPSRHLPEAHTHTHQ
jgi:hypothetical protein